MIFFLVEDVLNAGGKGVGQISVMVQIKFVKPKKLKPFRSVDRSKYLANMQATIRNGLPVSGLTNIKLIKVVFICVAVTKE